ncbi:hypothetical protein HPB50_002900 [Hyalomma asiaticum]|uniref:Uncharacterized protein n=1 Tax=Hyalomma asiaticum TaxID=266040 RepID=A0ACB7TE17_HYAAI|nr:hypothetical protein HPB50_002900 [Hyalomma asiaticum]
MRSGLSQAPTSSWKRTCLFFAGSKSSNMAATFSHTSPADEAVPAPKHSVDEAVEENKLQETAGSGATPLLIEPNPQYITSPQGILTALETLGAATLMVLYLLMGQSVTYQWYAHAAFLLAFTYCLNNTLIIISAMASPSTQSHLQQTLYYSLYHCTAGLLFLVGCAVFYGVDRGDGLRFRNFTGPDGTDAGAQEGGVADVNDVPQHIEVSVRYITTAQGTLTCLEALGAAAIMVLYLLMAHTITYQWYVRVAFLLAFTYALNNVLIIISGVASPCTQLHLPETLFYSLYHCMAGVLYVIGGAILHNVHKHDGLLLRVPAGYDYKRSASRRKESMRWKQSAALDPCHRAFSHVRAPFDLPLPPFRSVGVEIWFTQFEAVLECNSIWIEELKFEVLQHILPLDLQIHL